MMSDLVELNPELDVKALASEFARAGRLQVRDILTGASAERLRTLLAQETPGVLPGKPERLRPPS